MLHLHFSNRYETLTRQLLDGLGRADAGVFGIHEIVMPSAAVQRSLTLALARHDGICANVAFSYLAPWLWRQASRVVPGVAPESPFRPAVLTWRIHAALACDDFVAAQPRLAAYLADADAVMRFELAERIATLFDRYLTDRPDWLEAWRAGRPVATVVRSETSASDERWQAALWRHLTAAANAPALDTAAAFDAAVRRLGPAGAEAAGLASAVHVFALPGMPAAQLAGLQQTARVAEVHVYVLNPCQEYWTDVVDRRRLARLSATGQIDHQEVGNRLLAAWGRQTQAHIEALVEVAGEGVVDDGDYAPNHAGTLLAQVQNAVLELTELAPGAIALADDDASLEIHVCHSLTRELEVLQDHLLGLFASGAVQKPSDILVVTPDLDAAAPLIDAVFGTAPPDRQIAYSLSGRARSRVNAPARALAGLLALVGSRLQASAVFSALQQPVVAARFGLDDAALQQVHASLRASSMRWGFDDVHRAGHGVPATHTHTWSDGLDRLFLGYALPARVDEPFADLLPAGDAEGADALVLGALWQFLDRLRALHAAVAEPLQGAAWHALLLGAIDDFLAPAGDEIEDARELRAAIGELCDAMERGGAEAPPLPLSVMRVALERQLDDPARGGVPTGGVTFTSMASLRGLPFTTVCAIGLDDGAFPGVQRPAEFDLMALAPRRGDRQRRLDDRNLFLDLLLAARGSVYLSYTGRSVRDNAPLPPSVLVSELLDVLVPAIADEPGSADSLAQARRRLCVEHPLQPFSLESFDPAGDPRRRSFNRELAAALQRSVAADPAIRIEAIATAAPDQADADADADETDDAPAAGPLPVFFPKPLPPLGPEWREVHVEQLTAFFRNPCRALLKQRLGIDLGRPAPVLQDDEPFLPDRASRGALAERVLGPLRAGADADAVRRLALAGHELPAGPFGQQQLDAELASLRDFADLIGAHTAAACLPPQHLRVALDLDGEPWQLVADFADLRADGLVRWRRDELRAADVLTAWIAHLALCSASPSGVARRTVWLSTDGVLRLAAPADPQALLAELLRLYRRGLGEPLSFFPKAAWAYATATGSPIKAARTTWRRTKMRPHAEEGDPAYRLALRGRGDVLDRDFEALARAVFAPVLAAMHAGDAE